MSRTRVAAWLCAGLLALGGPVAGQDVRGSAPSIRVRTGIHPTFTRIVFDWPDQVPYSIVQNGETAELHFARPARLDATALSRPLRNLAGAEPSAEGMVFALRPGVRVRDLRVGNSVVVDLMDPVAPAAAPPRAPQPAPPATAQRPPATAAAPPQPAPGAPVPEASAPPRTASATPASPPKGAPPAPPPVVAAPAPVAVVPPPPAPMPVAAPPAATSTPPAATSTPPAATSTPPAAMPVATLPPAAPPIVAPPPGTATGPAPIRLPFTGATAAVMRGDSVLLVFEDATAPDIAMLRRISPLLAGAEIVEMPGGTALRLPAASGISRDAQGWLITPATAPSPRGPSIDPTRLGNALSLLPDARHPMAAHANIPRLLHLRDESDSTLLARRQDLLARIATAPAAMRDSLRGELAETLLALGLAPEAQAALRLATGDDPRRVEQPQALLLSAAAALLAGRLEDARDALANPVLPADGEVALWRGVAAMQEDGRVSDPAFRAALPLLTAYPAALRNRLLPPIAAALAEGGAMRDAAALIEAGGDASNHPLSRFAWARVLEARNEVEPALLAYTTLTESRDRDARARAIGRLAELRLATGRIDAAAAAEALEAAIPAWRGDRRELQRRQRAAELRTRAGQHGQALALMQDTASAFPEAAESLRAAMRGATVAALADANTPPLDATRLLAEQRANLVPDPALDAAVARIADRLMAMELPAQAATLLREAVPNAADPGGLSVRLAEARLAEGDATAALEALRNSGGAALPGEIGLRRALAEANARRQTGDRAGAIGVLRALGPDGAAPLAELLAEGQDWAGAAAALNEHMARSMPAEGALDDAARRDLLRMAAFLALAGDQAGLDALRDRYAPRLPAGAFTEAFAALASRSTGTLNLPRLREEIAGARALQNQSRALR
ncbi:hypothetical protein G3576_17075 [Roseomonas stagni]|uniref:Tetratricopeptide repeat protein n=1 Tax=Falsiroseomonas algicola TaxID=2716930 RepID=A0A6M1LP08_9PROT|nr:hypothetical protein [Falsiroseomonas algicola]NGM21739.1 hypothetical protein [Falsiroseomonas algicola]